MVTRYLRLWSDGCGVLNSTIVGACQGFVLVCELLASQRYAFIDSTTL